jgi:hypothetical protein
MHYFSYDKLKGRFAWFLHGWIFNLLSSIDDRFTQGVYRKTLQYDILTRATRSLATNVHKLTVNTHTKLLSPPRSFLLITGYQLTGDK